MPDSLLVENCPRLACRRGRRIVLALAGGLTLLVAAIGRPAAHLLSTALDDVAVIEPTPAGFADDASRLNRTAVAEVASLAGDPADIDSQLSALLARARAEGRRVSIAGARHTMGGHTIYPGGLVIDMLPFHAMQLDEEKNRLHVQAGATWAQIIPFLDAHGRSVAVMQSNNSFSVGGSLSANCHGWQFGRPPIASTVESFRLMKADGQVVRCSRDENAELFSLVLGGYGLFGIILDVDLRVVPNERYRLEQFVVPTEQALAAFDRHIAGRPDAAMAYGRMSVDAEHFLGETMLSVFYRDPAPEAPLPPLTDSKWASIERTVLRGSAGSDYGKRLRWQAETKLQPTIAPRYFSRNQLLNEGVERFQQRSPTATDILHEYFLPRDGLPEFVARASRILPSHAADLLNVTIREVETDNDSMLRYADQPVFALVMLFDQQRTAAAEADMQALTRQLIDAAIAGGGRYYLPYRLHATTEQFRRAYPAADRFFALKRQYDPDELFQNEFYLKYKDP
ncbi:MAG TPA: FAD-binding oxidoreductase [Pirellulales bacterium]|nr:FAD-binding oxidoreductase [Pirellulales bacterium]